MDKEIQCSLRKKRSTLSGADTTGVVTNTCMYVFSGLDGHRCAPALYGHVNCGKKVCTLFNWPLL